MEDKEVKKDIINRLKTIKGHIQGIENMIEEGKECHEILLQVNAIKSSVEKVGLLIIEDNAKECLIKDNISSEEVENIVKSIIKFLK
ncbi:metal-sensitive transcriptional regulator [Alkaliphilus peptidifermentans]|uniref:DNA-binding transcriptional regulator, FrmR family n=1 Tax=Alkaliphilus peptidifermentans DSM 18978 TaxID=1120976 RepID=A0A1G5HWB5_9FIRM|nr:metal-sensitive transcriptional regulator [Alkaliphilus peptidifermentans]SCY67328.1 DNA-binding transcriptional regulator, FrmR family [Alkaliphilus peptidifermentans DSM 18978]